MSYTGESLSWGDKPSTGWEYTLAFLAPDTDEFPSDGVRSTKDAVKANNAGRIRKSLLVRLQKAGFSYSQLWVPAAHVILVRIALPEEKLHEVAEKIGFELKLVPRFGGGYLEYSAARRRCYVNSASTDFFTPAERLQLNLEVLGSTASWGAKIDVENLIHRGALVDSFPLHDRKVRNKLLKDVVYHHWWDPFFRPNFRRLKDYLGIRCALYFAYLNFFTRMLVGISAISIPYFWYLKSSPSSSPSQVWQFLYCCCIIFWAGYFIKFWNRRNAILNVKWGNFEDHEELFYEVRPQFIGNPRKGFYSRGGFVDLQDLDADSAVLLSGFIGPLPKEAYDSDEEEDGDDTEDRGIAASLVERIREDHDFEFEEEDTGEVLRDLPVFPYSDRRVRQNRIYTTWVITGLFTLIVLALTFLIIFFKAEMIIALEDYWWGKEVPGILTGILIFIGENGWKFVYPILAKWENHRTKQSYMDSLILKRFSFEFVVSKLFSPKEGISCFLVHVLTSRILIRLRSFVLHCIC